MVPVRVQKVMVMYRGRDFALLRLVRASFLVLWRDEWEELERTDGRRARLISLGIHLMFFFSDDCFIAIYNHGSGFFSFRLVCRWDYSREFFFVFSVARIILVCYQFSSSGDLRIWVK